MLIDHKATHVYLVGDFKFMPGVNSVSKQDWEKIKDHPHVKFKLENDDLKIISDKESGDEQESAAAGVPAAMHSLMEFSPKDALRIVDSTFDVDLLKSWEQDEKRKVVRVAIVAQVKKIMGSAFQSSDPEATHFKS